MPRFTCNSQCRAGATWGWVAALAVGLASVTVHTQNRPPLPQEPVATEGTVKQFYRGLNVVVVKTMDGIEHVYQFTKDLVVHGGKKPGVDALEDLHEGTTVVIHYSTSGATSSAEEIDLLGDEGLRITEGVVTDINRRNKEITITFANGKTETLQMTGRAAVESAFIDASSGKRTRIVVYYSDETGRKVAHYFKKSS
jgi:hypothetical protein